MSARLPNDCFALPAGVNWTPVETALARLKEALCCVVESEKVPLERGVGRVLAKDMLARLDHPPLANAAVDGYAVKHSDVPETLCLPLMQAARAAAGAPFMQGVPAAHAIRILTGAAMPAGVDTVILQEDSVLCGETVSFSALPKQGANVRPQGEDSRKMALVLPKGHVMRAPDLALAASVGYGDLPVLKRLRVGVLSTGDELVAAGKPLKVGQIADANGPMLRALIEGWGMQVVDLPPAPDDRDALRSILNTAASQCDAILSSGGASAGDEDHLSAILSEEGSLQTWRIAVKPGRPLALGQWRGVPLFGLPGNPVAAFVTAVLFARPALGLMAGRGWQPVQGRQMQAAFTKSKKAGRREYLRAQCDGQSVQRFSSEGSGRISGLSWANGLIELPDEALTIEEGSLVRFLPYEDLLKLS